MYKKFVVYRRNDGYIDGQRYLPANYVTGGDDPLVKGGPRPGAGVPVTFEFLKDFDDWWEAAEFIREQRKLVKLTDEFVSFGDVARNRCNEQCQYAAREEELYRDLRMKGERSNYHSMEIHRDDVETFVARYLEKHPRQRPVTCPDSRQDG